MNLRMSRPAARSRRFLPLRALASNASRQVRSRQDRWVSNRTSEPDPRRSMVLADRALRREADTMAFTICIALLTA